MPECSKRVILTVATGVFGITSLICLTIAISTDYWLYAVERFAEDHTATNLTKKLTVTGLWRKCVQLETEVFSQTGGNCSYINYFKSQDKDGLGPTDAILLSLRKSTLFPLISLVILLGGQVVYIMSHCDRNKKVLTFVSGIVFVIAGLLILIGIILYIGAITEEAGSKSKPNMEKPKFEYWYGYSFVLTITSFSTAELTGVLSVYLYISRNIFCQQSSSSNVTHKHSYRKKAERLHQNQNYTTSFNQLHSRSAVSLSNVVEVNQKQQQQQQQQQSSSNDPFNNNATTTNTSRSPNTIRSNGRANGYIGGLGPFGLRADDCAGYVQQQQQQMFANNNNNNNSTLPAYDASPMYVVDSRDMEAQSSYQQKALKQHPLTSWSSSCFQQPQQQTQQQKLLMSKPASSASMLMMMSGHVQQPHEQWLTSDMPHATPHNSNVTADYNYHNDERSQRNDVDDDDDDDDLESTSNYEQSTPRMLVSVMTGAPITAGMKSRESSKHALASGVPQSTTNMNTPLSSEWFTPNHARNLGTPDNMYRRTTPV